MRKSDTLAHWRSMPEGRDPLPLSDPGVLKDLKKVLAGERLSPVLVAEADIADGYHRCAANDEADINVIRAWVGSPKPGATGWMADP